MSGDNSDDFGSLQTLHRLWEFFRGQAMRLENVQSLIKKRQDPIWLTILPLLYSVTDTNKSILLLAREGKLRDTYILSRTAYETILNACFIITEGEEAADRAYKHALQKSWRDLDRELIINDTAVYIRHNNPANPSQNPQLQDAIDEFTTKRGYEVTSWTPESLKARIAKIGAKYGQEVVTGLQFGMLAIYRHASDISHGTLFGAMFAVGLTQPTGLPESPAELVHYQRSHLCMLLTMLGGVIDSLLRILGQELGETEFVKQSQEAVTALLKEPWVERENAS